jgi:hypothetical protein
MSEISPEEADPRISGVFLRGLEAMCALRHCSFPIQQNMKAKICKEKIWKN